MVCILSKTNYRCVNHKRTAAISYVVSLYCLQLDFSGADGAQWFVYPAANSTRSYRPAALHYIFKTLLHRRLLVACNGGASGLYFGRSL